MEVVSEKSIDKINYKSKTPEYIKNYNKLYYEINKTKRKEYDNVKNVTVLCSCGKRVKALGMSSHIRTTYHEIYNTESIKSINNSVTQLSDMAKFS